MESIKVDPGTPIMPLIESMEANKRYEMPVYFPFEKMWIEKGNDYYTKEKFFTWGLEYNYDATRRVGYVHPLESSNIVKHFKTEGGAKRSLIMFLGRHPIASQYLISGEK